MTTATIGTFPFWLIEFNEDGVLQHKEAVDAFVKDLAAKGVTDLFLFSHGWNNDPATARKLYDGFFDQISKLAGDSAVKKKRKATIGTAGVIWPSILWPDHDSAGGGASLGGKGNSAAVAKEMKKVFVAPHKHKLVDDLVKLVDARAKSDASLLEFKQKLGALMTPPEGASGKNKSPDAVEAQAAHATDAEWKELLRQLGDASLEASPAGAGGAAGLGDLFGKLWDGAKSLLRMTTYYEMKQRAGLIGRKGLGPFLGQLQKDMPKLRVHLLGHSFGARLVSFSLAGLPASAQTSSSPVKSLFLLQGAFSHFTFAEKLPFDAKRKGDLAGMSSRVDGPLLTTHSRKDSAVTLTYPLASFFAGQDAADAADQSFRWGGMGFDGAQAVDAASATLGPPGTAYPFAPGKWINLDGNKVIVKGGPPSGAHSDIIYPHTAWAALAAAGIVG